MSRRRRILSTHLIRVRARAARRHYLRLQSTARADRVGDAYAALADLDLGLTDHIQVEKATHQRGKWVVVAVPAKAEPGIHG